MLGSLAKKKKKSSWKKFYHPKTARIEQQMLSEKVIVFYTLIHFRANIFGEDDQIHEFGCCFLIKCKRRFEIWVLFVFRTRTIFFFLATLERIK